MSPFIVKPTEAKPNPPTATNEQTRGERRFYLGTQSALVVITAFGIAIAVCTLRSLNRSVSASIDQAHSAATQACIAQQEFELSERPWVSVVPTRFTDLVFDKNGAHIGVTFSLENSGHSPADHVDLEAQLLPLKAENFVSYGLNRQKEICGVLRAKTDEKIEFGTFSLFPNVAIPKSLNLSVGSTEITNAEQHQGPKPFLISMLVVGCVDYRFEFESGHHQTGFLYSLDRIDPQHPGAPFVIYPEDGTLPMNLVAMSAWPFGNAFYAD
jgi:hypothetical protein